MARVLIYISRFKQMAQVSIQKLICKFKFKKWPFSTTQKDEEPHPKYVDLAPTDKADEAGIYSDALTYATNNPNVSNIALTGPYGSGKSSIIKKFLATYEPRPLQISLAAFLPENNHQKKGKVSKHEIERGILQQMFYGAEANSLPLSRFKRIPPPKWWSRFTPLFIVLGFFACWHMVQGRNEILSAAFFKPFGIANWFNLISFVVGFSFLLITVRYIYIKSLGISFKSISLKDIEITPESSEEESILNRHLDEIIYFFQSTKYDLVVIEDLDRFDNPDIFVTLREINSLINANAGIKRPIRFLYAIRDDIFVNTDRTKFFEFIVPVIPIINSSNSIDKVLEQGERLSLAERLDPRFLRDVSRYLNDLRLIRNIFNEYVIYVANLETDGESILNANKLLAILIYKNVLPSDFEELHRDRGNLKEIFNKHDEYITRTENKSKARISELQNKIADAEKQLPSDLGELRKIYAMTLIANIPEGYNNIEFNEDLNILTNTLWDYEGFDDLIEAQKAIFKGPNRKGIPFNPSDAQKEVNANKTYQDRKEEIHHKSKEFKDATLKAIQELKTELLAIRADKFNEIMRANAEDAEELFKDFGENKYLMRFLVFEGFLDDTYYQYISLFHSGRLSPNDNKFLRKISDYKNPDPSFQIDNPKEVIDAMRDEDFRRSFALNKTLVDCMFSNRQEYNLKIEGLIGFIRSNFEECRDFFTIYYGNGKHVSKLIPELFSAWPDFVSAAVSSPDRLDHIAQMIAHLPKNDLEILDEKSPGISQFISVNFSEILSLEIKIDPIRVKAIQFEIESLETIEPHPAILQMLIDEGMYEISTENLEFIFRHRDDKTALGDLQTKHYSTILKSEEEVLKQKVEDEFDHYLQFVLLQSENNTEEDVSAIIKALNHDEIENEYLGQFISKQSINLPSLDQIPEHLHSMIFDLRKIEVSWENCLSYMVSDDFDESTLTKFLDHEDSLSELSSITVAEDGGNTSLEEFLLNNSDFTYDTYQAFIRMLPRQFDEFPEECGEEQWSILIEEESIAFSSDTFAFLAEHEVLQLRFFAKNIETYFETPDEYEIDDDFRENLLPYDISDEQKLKIIDEMDLSEIYESPSLTLVVDEVLQRDEGVSAIIMMLNHDEIESEYLEQFIEKQPANLSSLDQVPERFHSMVFRLRKIEVSWENCLAYINSGDFEKTTLTEFLNYDDNLSKLSLITVDGGEDFFPLREFLFNNNGFRNTVYQTFIRTLPKSFKHFPEECDQKKWRVLIVEGKVHFSSDSFSFLAEHEDLQLLFVAKNIGAYLENSEEYEIDDDFREKLLSSEINDEQKVKIMEEMDLSQISVSSSLAFILVEVLDRTNLDIDEMTPKLAQAFIIFSNPSATQISLFNKYQSLLSKEQVQDTLQRLHWPFSKIKIGGGRPEIRNTPENKEFVRWLTSRSIVSSVRFVLHEDKFHIYNYRK